MVRDEPPESCHAKPSLLSKSSISRFFKSSLNLTHTHGKMTRDRRKRSRDDYDRDHHMSVGQTLQYLKDEANGKKSESSPEETQESRRRSVDDNDDDGGEWEVAESHRSKKRKKMPKKEGGNYPSISHSSHSRLQTFVKLGDLQNLALYVLADGTAPQWCAVRHHTNVRKVVALMVPGLEADMFDGKIDLSQAKEDEKENGAENSTNADSTQLDEKGNDSSKAKDVSDNSSFQLVMNSTSRPSPDDYYPTKLKRSRLSGPLQPLSDIFEHLWPVKTPGDDKNSRMHSPLAAMLTVPLFKSKEEKRAKGPQPPRESKDWKNKRTEITELLATTAELIEEGFVLHPAHYNNTLSAAAEIANREVNKTTTSDGWVDTPDVPTLDAGNVADEDIEQGSILAGRKVLAMDCEMCITSPSGVTPQIFSLTRVSVIDWDGNVVMDELVKPENPITDYLTPYSGITAEKLANVTTTLQEVQEKLINDILTPQTILVGHSLIADLNAVQLTHPFIIDTALLFPHPRGPPLKSSLKWLTQKYLSREIQKGHGSTGHDSVEDALACLDLVKQKCEKGKTWGTSEASGESIFKRLGRSIRPKRVKMIPGGNDEPRIGAVVDWGDPTKGYGGAAKVTIGCENDDDVVAGIKRALKGDEDESRVPHGGVDFVFARMRELEAYRGWWSSSKTSDGDVRRNNANSITDSVTLAQMVSQTVARVEDVWDSLPPCTALIMYSGSGDPRELGEMQALQQKFKEEYRVKKWDELSVRWTDVEEQKLRSAANKARMGVGFLAVK